MAPSRRTLVTGTLVVAALFLGTFINDRFPSPADVRQAPFVHRGSVGTPVTMRLGTVTVTEVTGSTQVKQFGSIAVTSQVWIVVRLEYTAVGEPRSLTGATLRTGNGRSYGSGPLTNACTRVQPGIPVRCSFGFEIPKAAAPGALLMIPADPASPEASDDQVQIDLGLTAADVARFGASTTQVDVPETQPKE